MVSLYFTFALLTIFGKIHSDCTIKVPATIKVYEYPSMNARVEGNTVYEGDTFIYTCEEAGHMIESPFGDNVNYAFVKVVCTNSIFEFAKPDDTVVEYDPTKTCTPGTTENYCLKSTLPDMTGLTDKLANGLNVLNNMIDTFGVDTKISFLCPSPGNFKTTLEMRCSASGWALFDGEETVDMEPLAYCAELNKYCMLVNVSGLINYDESIMYVKDGGNLIGTCPNNDSIELSFACSDTKYSIIEGTTSYDVTLAKVVEICLSYAKVAKGFL